MHIEDCVLVKQPGINKLMPPFMVTAERRNKSITLNKEHFILLPIDNINKLNYRNITNNNKNYHDYDFDLVKLKGKTKSILVQQ